VSLPFALFFSHSDTHTHTLTPFRAPTPPPQNITEPLQDVSLTPGGLMTPSRSNALYHTISM